MSFNRFGYQFDGIFYDPSRLQPFPGVYIVWCITGNDWQALDVGEAEDVRERLLNHDRKECWTSNCRGTIFFSAIYTRGMHQQRRMDIEANIMRQAKPVCGER